MYFHDICGAKIENIDNITECPECLCTLDIEDISRIPDGGWVKRISTDESFMNAMVELYEKDPIEYQLKIQQFKTQLQQQESTEQVAEQNRSTTQSNQRTCKFCGSTSFTPVKRKWSPLTGFFTNKTDLVCNNCGKKVQWIDM